MQLWETSRIIITSNNKIKADSLLCFWAIAHRNTLQMSFLESIICLIPQEGDEEDVAGSSL